MVEFKMNSHTKRRHTGRKRSRPKPNTKHPHRQSLSNRRPSEFHSSLIPFSLQPNTSVTMAGMAATFHSSSASSILCRRPSPFSSVFSLSSKPSSLLPMPALRRSLFRSRVPSYLLSRSCSLPFHLIFFPSELFAGLELTLFLAGIMALSSNDIKVGTELEIDGAPWRVIGIFLNPFFSSLRVSLKPQLYIVCIYIYIIHMYIYLLSQSILI